MEKKLVFEAVIGVLGVFAFPRLGGGVMFPSSVSEDGSCNAAILAAVGVLRGNRLRGGKRRGCSFFLFMDGAALAFGPRSRADPIVRPLLSRASSVTPGIWTCSVVEVLMAVLTSRGRLGLRAEKKGWSNSAFGDS